MLTPDMVHDFVNLTLPHFKRYEWTDISLEHQEYVASRILTKEYIKISGGPTINFKLKYKNTGNARNTGMFAIDKSNIEDVTIEGSVPWTMQTTNYSYSIYEDLFQSDKETIIRELQLRDHDAMSDFAELSEENLWSAPTSPTDKRPMGIPFWLQKDASTNPEGGFHGGNPSGFPAGCAGISSLIYNRYSNWTFGYDQLSTDDFVRKVKKAINFTKFQAPVPHPELGFGKSRHQMYTTYRVQEPLERLAETRNDNLGSDVARYMNQVIIGGIPISWVPYLEANDTSDPLYGIDWRYMRPYVKTGCNMRRNPPKSTNQHDTFTVHIDHWMNWVNVDRRRHFVGSKA